MLDRAGRVGIAPPACDAVVGVEAPESARLGEWRDEETRAGGRRRAHALAPLHPRLMPALAHSWAGAVLVRREAERSGEKWREVERRVGRAARAVTRRAEGGEGGAGRSTLLRHRRPRLPPSSGCVPSSSTSPAMPAHRTPGGGEWRLVNFGAASGALLRPPQASKLLRRRSGICGGGLSLRSHQAGSWGGVLQQGGEGASHQLARRRA